ncbi:MAG: hypothetical protein IPP30_03890 [Flavobacterium sp.]|nr:hypothetical protein [Flavobacterium sp.]
MKTTRLFIVAIIATLAAIQQIDAQNFFAPVPPVNLVTGNDNTAIGDRSMYSNVGGNPITVSGFRNTAVGKMSLNTITSGSDNTAIGHQAMYVSGMGSSNVAVGERAGFGVANGNCNTLIGANCGGSINFGIGNTFLGRVVSTGDVSNRVILADGGIAGVNNGFGRQRLYIDNFGRTGIDVGDNPILGNRLVINSNGTGAVAGTTGLRFMNFAIPNPMPTATNFLTVDPITKDVILRALPSGGGAPTVIQAGTNITVNGSGITSDPFVINSPTPKTLYTHDGTIETSQDPLNPNYQLRSVTMKDCNLFFDTADAASYPNTGKIYIGDNYNFNSSTGDYRLYVEGGILTEKVKVALRYDGSGGVDPNWADYVFANDYKLMPLKEIESFVKENKHLPGIESACELIENGLDLGDMQAKQMGKIEELTLYAIEQEKRLDKQSKEIEELKAIVKTLLEKK